MKKKLGALGLVVAALIPARAVLGASCEQWQDFLYVRDTGDFLTWVGEPYWVCEPSNPDTPPTRPVNELRGEREGRQGGQGSSVASMCEECRDSQEGYARRADRMLDACRVDVLWRSQALCEAGYQRGRPRGQPIPRHVIVRERVCEDDGRDRPRCGFAYVRHENPDFAPCLDNWTWGFSPAEIAARETAEGLRIDTNAVPVDYTWNGETHMGLLGAGEYFDAVCVRDNERELEVAEDMFDDCEANINEVLTTRGRAAISCR